MSDRSVSPFTVHPNPNLAAAAAASAPPALNPPALPPALPLADDIDPDNEYLQNLRSLFGPRIDMANPFAQTRRRHTPFTIASVLRSTDYKEEWEPKKRRSDAYLTMQSKLCTFHSVTV